MPFMHRHLLARIFLLTVALFSLNAALADPAILATAERYAVTQSQGLPGEVTVKVGTLDPSTRMPACNSLHGFTPPGAKLWGKTHVGVRCLGPNPWNVLVPVQITVTGNYVVTARALGAGQALQPGDLAVARGDITTLPTGVVTDIQMATGKTLKNSLAAGQPLRADLLLAPILIRQGQIVKLFTRGPGFTVSAEGKAINNASEGQVVQVRVNSGQTISGVVQPDGSAEVVR